MRWLTLALQLISFRSRILESQVMIENAKAAAEKGKRAAIFSGFLLLALVYFIVGSILAIVEVGLQIDRGVGLGFTGLLGSALFLIFVAVCLAAIGAIVSANPKQEEPAPQRATDPGTIVEEILVTFLTRFSEKLKDKSGTEKTNLNAK